MTVVDVRAGAEHASGARPQQLVAALLERGLRAETPQYPAQIQAAPQVIALTRLPRSDLQEGRRLQELLRARPDTVVVHLGVPDAAPDHRRMLLAHGAGRTMMRAAVAAMLPEPTR